MIGYVLAFTPSLLPRPWWLQAAACAITAVITYGIGALVGLIVHRCGIRPEERLRRIGWLALAGAGGAAVVFVTAWSVRWQGDLRRAVHMDPLIAWWEWVLVLPLTAVLFAVFVLVARALRLGTRQLARLIARVVPARWATAAAAVLAAVLVVGFVQGFLLRGLLTMVESGASATDLGTSPGIVRPELATLSGSPASLESWDSLGSKGRDFIGKAPTAAEITRFTGQSAKDPVRVYVGLRSAGTLQERAALAVRELERTGAFSRRVLVVVSTTGTGWVNERIATPPEYMYGGDSALVAMQYSYLPSWVSFLAEGEATEAGLALIDAVRTRWAQLPADARPRLLVAGESLGSYATERAFPGGVAQLVREVDGALLVGPTPDNPIRRTVTDGRDPGSAVWRPVYQDGRTVRFAQRPVDLQRPAATWEPPRVVYLQNGGDPVTWWEPSLIWRRPAWLDRPRAPDVSDVMRWYPLVTFWQVTCDLAAGESVPDGFGHRFGTLPTDAWAQIAPPAGWSAAETRRLDAYQRRVPSLGRARRQ
ncbi:alpha/beta hydrolase [Kitasatospora cystarginea]|uniref:Alpha/beta hydrolase n=1 Tax=Kitasatospora cystarginea TaxID=58350 RepID=A0ABP5RKD7_9ACTN